MARANGLALAPWNVLAGGKLRSDEEEKKRLETGEKGRDMYGVGWQRNENETKMSHTLEKIGKEVGGSISAGESKERSILAESNSVFQLPSPILCRRRHTSSRSSADARLSISRRILLL